MFAENGENLQIEDTKQENKLNEALTTLSKPGIRLS
jgi:hypothetical protein